MDIYMDIESTIRDLGEVDEDGNAIVTPKKSELPSFYLKLNPQKNYSALATLGLFELDIKNKEIGTIISHEYS